MRVVIDIYMELVECLYNKWGKCHAVNHVPRCFLRMRVVIYIELVAASLKK